MLRFGIEFQLFLQYDIPISVPAFIVRNILTDA